jgi:hypothetical protein
MLKVAILDDYQNVSQEFVDLENYLESMNLKYLANHLLMKQMH